MTTRQRNRSHAAAAWRATCRAAAALRAIHDEQVLMWELLWQSNCVAVERTGPLAWTPQLGRALPIPGDTGTGNTHDRILIS
jgi:hypothetical protein